MDTSLLMVAALCGVVVAGFVWFGWSLVENLLYAMRKRTSQGPENGDVDGF